MDPRSSIFRTSARDESRNDAATLYRSASFPYERNHIQILQQQQQQQQHAMVMGIPTFICPEQTAFVQQQHFISPQASFESTIAGSTNSQKTHQQLRKEVDTAMTGLWSSIQGLQDAQALSVEWKDDGSGNIRDIKKHCRNLDYVLVRLCRGDKAALKKIIGRI